MDYPKLEPETVRWQVRLDGVPISSLWVTAEHMNGQCHALRALGKDYPRVTMVAKNAVLETRVTETGETVVVCPFCADGDQLHVAGMSFATSRVHPQVAFDAADRPTLCPAESGSNYGDWGDEVLWCANCDAMLPLPKGGVSW